MMVSVLFSSSCSLFNANANCEWQNPLSSFLDAHLMVLEYVDTIESEREKIDFDCMFVIIYDTDCASATPSNVVTVSSLLPVK